ncbi:unnamed protein product [Rotaria sordida]|nr:unnamed protein product [Rotaria sordida]
MENKLFYNCTQSRFGSKCQYSFDFQQSTHLSLNEIISNYYNQSYELKTLTCYTNLKCNRDSKLICLDWSEICDGKIDCDNEIDEKYCWALINKE